MLTDLIKLQERVAASMWKADAMRTTPNVGKQRSVTSFAKESAETRSRWLELAGAAILEITFSETDRHK